MTFAIVVFAATYILMVALPRWRCYVALAAAAIFIAVGVLPFSTAPAAVDWNILLMLFGTMGTVTFFIRSQMPMRMAEALLEKMPSAQWAIVIMGLFAGVISAFMDNVATLLMLAPVGIAIARGLKISPVAMLIVISVSSNLQGAATLVGDTTSIMLGGYAGMDFMDFFFFQGRFSIFWAVELGALATVPVILWLFHKENRSVKIDVYTEVKDYMPTILLCLNIVLLIGASFLPNKPAITNGLICTGIFLIAALYSLLRDKNTKSIAAVMKCIDYETLLLLGGLFLVLRGVANAGVIDAISTQFLRLGNGNLFLMYSLIVWGSVLFSAFIDNIPYVATMLPVVSGMAAALGCPPYVLYFGLLIGATLGGNLTPIGASANIAAIGILKKEGYTVRFRDFAKIGIPFTLTAVICGYLFIWLLWGV